MSYITSGALWIQMGLNEMFFYKNAVISAQPYGFYRDCLVLTKKLRVIVTDKLRSYSKPIKQVCKRTEHRRDKGLNNRVENAHQPTRRKEKCLIKFKSQQSVQNVLSLMGKTRNIFALAVGRYSNTAELQRIKFYLAKDIWDSAALELLYA